MKWKIKAKQAELFEKPVDPDRPAKVECETGDQYLRWCARAKAGEFRITTIERGPRRGPLWIIYLVWP